MQTFAQKALAKSAGLQNVSIGSTVDDRPDRILSHDNTAAISTIFNQFGLENVLQPEKLVVTLDHAAPPPTPIHARNHAEVRKFVTRNNIEHFFEIGRGICHQVISEEALILPGQLIIGADSHTTHFGWLGAFGAGVGRTEIAALWATGELWMRVPNSISVKLTGQLNSGVTTKDLCLHLIGQVSSDGGLYASIEFSGESISDLSIDSRTVIPNMMAELGAKNALIYSRIENDTGNPDFITGNEFARVGIVQNPKSYGTSSNLEIDKASAVYALKLTGVGASNATFTADDFVTQTIGIGSTAVGRVISYDQNTQVLKYWQDRTTAGFNTNGTANTSPEYGFKLNRFTNNVTANQGSLNITGGSVTLGIHSSFTGISTVINSKTYYLGQSFTKGVANPEVRKYSGNIIYVDNRPSITRSTNQKEDIKVILQF